MRDIDIATFATAQQAGAVIVDVREPREYAHGHVPGARLMPMGQLGSRLGELDRNKRIYLICASGNRSGNANVRQLAAERRMGEFTRQTGGTVYLPIDEDELDKAFEQISAELSQQYVLSYYPENDESKRGQLREISVEIKNRPNLTIRTRKGYYVR